MHYAKINKYDIANGPGVRVSLFVSGCRNACKGCFNTEAWDFNYGDEFTDTVGSDIIESLRPYYISGLTVLGGEPMEPENQLELLPFLSEVRRKVPDKTIWIYTGYVIDQLVTTKCIPNVTMRLLRMIDVLVDGRFVESLKDISLKFRGSSNQRIIDMKQTLDESRIITISD